MYRMSQYLNASIFIPTVLNGTVPATNLSRMTNYSSILHDSELFSSSNETSIYPDHELTVPTLDYLDESSFGCFFCL